MEQGYFQLPDEVLVALRVVDTLATDEVGLVFGRHPGAVLREAMLLLTSYGGAKCLNCKGKPTRFTDSYGSTYYCITCKGTGKYYGQPREGDALREAADWLQQDATADDAERHAIIDALRHDAHRRDILTLIRK